MDNAELDGFKFIARVRKSDRNANTRILVLSDRADSDAVLRARDLGVDGYVITPIDDDELLARLL